MGSSDPRWVRPGEPVAIGGVVITSGLFFVADSIVLDFGSGADAIDPGLPVASSDPDFAGVTLPLHPTFANIEPRARLAYLLWLADREPWRDIHPLYVSLFLAGLTRRMADAEAFDDGARIMALEVQRLARVYHSQDCVKRSVIAFLDAAEGVARRTVQGVSAGSRDQASSGLPAPRAVALGRIAVQRWATEQIADGGLISLKAAIKRFRGVFPSKLEAAEVIRVADALSDVGIGLVPDPRYDLTPPRVTEDAILFRLGSIQVSPLTPSPDFVYALTQVMTCLAVAKSDDDLADSELAYIDALIGSLPAMSDAERSRLHAEVTWLRKCPLPLRPLLNAVAEITPHRKAHFAEVIVGIVLADAQTPAAELSFAGAVYSALGLTDLDFRHALARRRAAPSILPSRPTETNQLDATQEQHSTQPTSSLASEQDDGDASALIAELFGDLVARSHAEEEELLGADATGGRSDAWLIDEATRDAFEGVAPADDRLGPTGSDDDPREFPGLDPRHARFLSRLVRIHEWQRAELERLARDCRLMPYGAVETVNDWALDKLDDLLIEPTPDGGAIVNPDLDLEKLRAAA